MVCVSTSQRNPKERRLTLRLKKWGVGASQQIVQTNSVSWNWSVSTNSFCTRMYHSQNVGLPDFETSQAYSSAIFDSQSCCSQCERTERPTVNSERSRNWRVLEVKTETHFKQRLGLVQFSFSEEWMVCRGVRQQFRKLGHLRLWVSFNISQNTKVWRRNAFSLSCSR